MCSSPVLMVHPTAIIHSGAELGDETEVGPYSVIGAHVKLGKKNRIGPHVVIEGHTTLGEENIVYQFASLGSHPQDLKFKGEPSQLVIGNRNIIREYVTLQPGTKNGGMITKIGHENLFMAGSHVAHDGRVGNNNIFANYCSMAGHVEVGSKVTIGGFCGIHQFVRLGDLCLLGAGSMVAKDIPPYCIAQGDRASLKGLNKIGLRRSSFNEEEISELKEFFKEVFWGGGVFKERLVRLQRKERASAIAKDFRDFLSSPSKRGITYPTRRQEMLLTEDDE